MSGKPGGIEGERQAACPEPCERARKGAQPRGCRAHADGVDTDRPLADRVWVRDRKARRLLQGAGLHTRFDLSDSTLIFGASFIVVGILGLLAAIVQHARILKRLSQPNFAYNAMRPIAMTVAAVLMPIGVFGLTAILW